MSLLYLASFLPKTHAIVSAFFSHLHSQYELRLFRPLSWSIINILDMNISVIIPW